MILLPYTTDDREDNPRIGLSLRFGIGLGITWGLLFVACLMNISSVTASAILAVVLLVISMLMGLWRMWLPQFIEDLKGQEDEL